MTMKRKIVVKVENERCCVDCGEILSHKNTRLAAESRKKVNPRCGGCYLRFKREERKRRGLQ